MLIGHSPLGAAGGKTMAVLSGCRPDPCVIAGLMRRLPQHLWGSLCGGGVLSDGWGCLCPSDPHRWGGARPYCHCVSPRTTPMLSGEPRYSVSDSDCVIWVLQGKSSHIRMAEGKSNSVQLNFICVVLFTEKLMQRYKRKLGKKPDLNLQKASS